MAPSLELVQSTVHRLFIDAEGARLRREDEQKCLELAGVLERLTRLGKGAHLIDAAAGKASVGLLAAELLPLGRLTVLERDPARVAACRAAASRLVRAVPVDVRQGDLADAALWPPEADAVVALHACGSASDRALDGVLSVGASNAFLVPCCYDEGVLSRVAGFAGVPPWLEVSARPLRRRWLSSLVDLERVLRLEEGGYETKVEELVAPTVTPHNLVICARRTRSEVRMARARTRLAELRGRSAQ